MPEPSSQPVGAGPIGDAHTPPPPAPPVALTATGPLTTAAGISPSEARS